jgi:hypothetical protein
MQVIVKYVQSTNTNKFQKNIENTPNLTFANIKKKNK